MKANTTTVSKNDLSEVIFALAGSILLFFLILFASLNHATFNKPFYENEFQKTGVYDNFGKENADAQTRILLDYLDGKSGSIDSDFFNEKEKQHMVDVKKLIDLSKIIVYSLFILIFSIFFLMIRKGNGVMKFISKTFMFTGILTFIFFIAAYFLQDQFSQIFYNFHMIFFSNKLWLLDPATDNLINLFPEQFFYDMTFEIVKNTLMFSTLFFIEGTIILFRIMHR